MRYLLSGTQHDCHQLNFHTCTFRRKNIRFSSVLPTYVSFGLANAPMYLDFSVKKMYTNTISARPYSVVIHVITICCVVITRSRRQCRRGRISMNLTRFGRSWMKLSSGRTSLSLPVLDWLNWSLLFRSSEVNWIERSKKTKTCGLYTKRRKTKRKRLVLCLVVHLPFQLYRSLHGNLSTTDLSYNMPSGLQCYASVFLKVTV